jgi:ribosome-binding protein aMBF1 (putative translation factor)
MKGFCFKEDLSAMHVGSLIRQKCEERGMSKSELAKRIHCDRTNVYKIFERRHLDIM